MLFGEVIASREPKETIVLPDPDNIGVLTLVLHSLALISNICLLTEEALTGEPNEKEPTFNEELSSDNDEVIALELIPHPNCDGIFNKIFG